MSEPITWQSLTPVEQNRLVAATLFSWQPLQCDSEFEVYDSGMAQCGACHAYDFIGDIEHGIVEPRNYVKDWNAAMEVFHKVTGDYNNPSLLETSEPVFEEFADILLRYGDSYFNAELYPAAMAMHIVATWTPERICIAALRAYGVEITESEVQT